jgi:hypothetical protein
MIVPWPPGQATDLVGRVIALKLSDLLGQQVVADNRPGAGGMIGTDAVAKAAPDGYTLLAASTGPITTAPLVQRVAYDPTKDLLPVALFLPVLPIDETRYLAVAWEMRLHGDFLVPHLNGAPYSDKPPLLFWLINATAFAATHTLWERVLIFSICLGMNIVADVVKVLMAGKIREKLTPHNISVINKISGSILIIFGVALIYGIAFLKHKVG